MSYHAVSSVDSITDYNGFSPRRSREVYLTFLFKATFLFNCIISLIFISKNRVVYRSHLYRYRYLKFGTGTLWYLFSVFYSV